MAKILNNVNVVSEIGSLNGSYEDCLNYLSWTIDTQANKNFTAEQKGQAFFNAVKTLKESFGVGVSTQFLKRFCDSEMRGKNLHILYMLRVGGFMDITETPNRYMVNPSQVAFKDYRKTFDFLVFPNEWNNQKARENDFKAKCIKEWEEEKQMIEKEKIEADKLKIVSSLEEKPIDYAEMEEVSPHLIKRDITLMPKNRNTRGYH